MKVFKAKRRLEIVPTILTTVLLNVIGVFLIKIGHSYLILNLIIGILVICNLYNLYYIFLWLTIKYEITEDQIIIKGIWGLKNIKISLNNIESYTVQTERIRGIRLSGFASNRFALGRIAIKNLGTTRMFVTNSSYVVYLKTNEMNYGFSPISRLKFEEALKEKGIINAPWEKKFNKVSRLYKSKQFLTPLILSSVITLIITFNPLVLYLTNRLPDLMPLAFDTALKATDMGTDKQFVFAQMTYGICNMAILFCMYYASHFSARYDKKTALRYIYGSLGISIFLLLLQFRIITLSL